MSGSGNNLAKSDEEIIRDRKRLEAFDTADLYLGYVGLGFWGLSFVWFAYFSDTATVGTSFLYDGASDPSLLLLVSGCFCRGISKSSPRSWSSWRLGFHLSWCPVLALIAAAAALVASKGQRAVSSSTCWCISGGCAVMACGAILSYPGSTLGSGKTASAYVARLLFLVEGCAGMAIAVSLVMATAWSDSLGPLATAVATLPFFSCAAALCCCCAANELLAAGPCAMLFCILASLRAGYFGGSIAAAPTVALTVVHLYLYLPFPLSDPESNIFHMQMRKAARNFQKLLMMTSGTAGFGDEGDGAD